jgi:predicted TIM-barrel fold metal-dependent hydrolase
MYVHDFDEGGSGFMLEGRCLLRGVEAVTFAGQQPKDFLGKHWDEGYPGAFDPVHRVADMDSEGIDRAMLFPSLLGVLGGVTDAELAAAMARAYNRWMLDYCSVEPSRLFAAAVAPLQHPELAVAEVERVAAEGFRCVMVRPCPIGGRTVDHPELDRFFAACETADLVVGFHPFPFPDVRWTQAALPDLCSAPGSAVPLADLACLPMDNMLTMAYAMFGGVMDRHPRLRFAFLESNGSWAAMWIDRMEKRFLRGRYPAIRTAPSELVARQCFISLDGDEKALPSVASLIGEDVVVWASDFPHFDGKFPGAVEEAVEHVAGLPERVQRKFLGENAARMYRIPFEAAQPR